MSSEIPKLPPYKLNICSNFAGLGDHVARLPAIKYVHDTYTHVTMNIFWHDYVLDLVQFVLPSSRRLRHWPISRMYLADTSLPLIDFNYNRLSPLALDLTLHAFLALIDRLPPGLEDTRLILAPKVSLDTRYKLPAEYAILTPEFTSESRQWPAESVQQVSDWLVEQGVSPVILGTKANMSVGNGREIPVVTQEIAGPIIDIRGQTSLVEALGIIQGAKAIVGVDNGLLYLAGMTTTPRIRGMTTVIPKHRLAYGHGPLISINAQVDCVGCQSKAYFVKHDFRKCLYDRDFTCTKEMTGDRFIEALKGVI